MSELGVDLYTYVIDWNEYHSLMQAFFDADVIDVELLTDNAMLAVNYRQAAKHGVKYILAGTNQATEGMRIPSTWNWFKYDKKISKLWESSSVKSPKTFPAFGTIDSSVTSTFAKSDGYRFWTIWSTTSSVRERLQQDFACKPYPCKHYESVFTRFYQRYILPEKFGVDKRKIHLATLVVSGQMTREEGAEIAEGILSDPRKVGARQNLFPEKDEMDRGASRGLPEEGGEAP
ncbi:hypothetical protein MASR1M66_22510 [Aminivibrio sp.]